MDMDYQYLVGRLQEALAADARVCAQDIKVMVRRDKVHLTGVVATACRREAAAQVAAETLPGVEIRNELTVLELSGAEAPEPIRD